MRPVQSRSMPVTRRAIFATAAAGLLPVAAARADTAVHISIAELPSGVATPAFTEMMKIAFGKLPGVTLQITTAPGARSMAAMLAGEADMHIPVIRPPHEDGLPFAITTAAMYQTTFVLYTNKDKPVPMADLAKFKIETDAAHVGYFDFPITGGAGFEPSLQKLAAGRIDGYIFSGSAIDPIVERLGLKNIHRDVYKSFDVAAALPKAGKGGPLDQLFTKAMQGVEGDAAFKAQMQKITAQYRGPDWQMS